MIKEYRVWNHESSQGHYITGDSPKQVAQIMKDSVNVYYPIHVMLWKKGETYLRLTKQAIKFSDYHGDDKYTKYGRKYYKKDLK